MSKKYEEKNQYLHEMTEREQQVDILSVFTPAELNEIQQAISSVTGLAFVTVDYKGNPISEATKFCKFCQDARKEPNGELLCKLSDASGAIIAATNQKASIYFCPCGLLEIAIPIIVDGRYMGGFIGGQVMCTDAPDSVVRLSKNMILGGGDKSVQERDIHTTKIDTSDIQRYSYNEVFYISNLVQLIIGKLTDHELRASQNKRQNLKKIAELERKIRDLTYENKMLRSRNYDIKRSAMTFFDKSIFNTISNLAIIEDAPKTNEAILQYISMIGRDVIPQKEGTIYEELERIEYFVKINRIRYADRIHYVSEADATVVQHSVPNLLMLPYVAALMYQFFNTEEGNLHVRLEVYEKMGDVYMVVEDNGRRWASSDVEYVKKFGSRAMADSAKNQELGAKSHSLSVEALADLNRALINRFGMDYAIEIQRMPDRGTRVQVKYPATYGETCDYE